MAKDPAFPFFTQDFLVGTMFFTDEEVGVYVRLLCIQHQHGGLISKDMFTQKVNGNEKIRSKFIETDEGFFNERLMKEMVKRQKKSNNLSANALKRWKERDANAMQLHSKCNAIAMPPDNDIDNDKDKEDYNKELLEKICAYGQARNIPREVAEGYFHYYEKLDWFDGAGRKITRWQSGLINWWRGEQEKPASKYFLKPEKGDGQNKLNPVIEQMRTGVRNE